MLFVSLHFLQLNNHQVRVLSEDFGYAPRFLLDISEEVLVQIILHLNARERIAPGNSCQILVFQYKALLEDLNFSEDARFTSDDEDVSKYVLKVNLSNVHCIEPEPMLNNSIGRATNLVDIDIRGVIFTPTQLVSFLKPLVHNKKSCINWPDIRRITGTFCKVLEERFSRLTHIVSQTDE